MQISFLHKICLLLVISFTLIRKGATQADPAMPALSDGSNFFIIQKEMNDFYASNPTTPGYKQWKRKEWFLTPRLYPSGKMENLTLKTYKEYNRFIKTLPDERATHGSWNFIGPSSHDIGLGRINAIAFHPTDDDIMYIGAANGGVWKTTNGGNTWLNISPNIPLLSIADVKLSPSNPNVVYILTGDGDPQPSESNIHLQTEVSSIGILRSADGGGTWFPTDFSFDHPSIVVPTKLLIHPTDVNTQYVVCDGGIYRTTNHWEDYTLEWANTIYDIEFKPDNPNIMYASGTNIIKSINGGDDWTIVVDASFNFFTTTRIELAVAPNNANVVYALSGNWSGFLDFYLSTAQGNNNTWSVQNTTTTVMGSFADYCIALTVDPTDWTDVFGGMVGTCSSLDQGVTWTAINNGVVHADIHDIAYTNGALWVCCDGGLYKSTDEGTNWTDLTDGMAITEVYRITGTPANGELFFLGTQDNGTMRRNGNTSNFDIAFGNDGMTPLIDYTNSNNVIISWQNGNFEKSTTGGGNGSFTPLTIPGGNGLWITPIVMDPVDPQVLFVGKVNVYRSDDGGGMWQDLGSPTASGLHCLAQGTSNTNRLYASSGTMLYRTDNAQVPAGTATWTDIGDGIPNLAITGIAVHPATSFQVYVVVSGYTDGAKVYRSTNAGEDWTNISGSLPNVPVNCIEFHDNDSGLDELYIGTDIGVFYRNNTLGDWIYYNNSLPAVNISDLYIHGPSNTVIAATYGRGVWRSSTYSGCVENLSLTHLFGIPIGGVRYFSASNSISSSAIYKTDLGTAIHYRAGNFIDLTTDFKAGVLGYFEARIGGCPEIWQDPFMMPSPPEVKSIIEQTPQLEVVIED